MQRLNNRGEMSRMEFQLREPRTREPKGESSVVPWYCVGVSQWRISIVSVRRIGYTGKLSSVFHTLTALWSPLNSLT